MFKKRMRTLSDVYASLDNLRNNMTIKDAVEIYAICIEETKGLTSSTISELKLLCRFINTCNLISIRNKDMLIKACKSFVGNDKNKLGYKDKAAALNNFFQWCGYDDVAAYL